MAGNFRNLVVLPRPDFRELISDLLLLTSRRGVGPSGPEASCPLTAPRSATAATAAKSASATLQAKSVGFDISRKKSRAMIFSSVVNSAVMAGLPASTWINWSIGGSC